MKCLHCGSEVSMWATVCPYCHKNPGGIIEHMIYGFIKWVFIIGLIYGIVNYFIEGSGDKTKQPINKQSVETQQQITQEVKQTEKVNYIEDTEHENTEIQKLNEKQQENKEQEQYNNSSQEKHKNVQEDLISQNQAIYNSTETALPNTNTQDINFKPYMRNLQKRVKKNWHPKKQTESKKVVAYFEIAKDGTLLNSKIIETSGDESVDNEALSALKNTTFKPLPNEFKENSVSINFTFEIK